MTEENIQEILDRLGNRVSMLSEENRISKVRDKAGKELISNLAEIITPTDWKKIYESTENTFIRELMKEWGSNLFPENYEF